MISSSMVDLSDKGSGAEDMSSSQDQNLSPERVSSDNNSNTQIKTCSDCGTTKTPLWRGGPAGPKSLCNACGIRSRKKRRALLGLNKEDKKSKKSIDSTKKKKTIITHENQSYNSCTSSTSSEDSKSSNNSEKKIESSSSSLKLKFSLLPFGREVVLQRPRSSSNRRRKLGEEEQAAFLLMALSCGSVYA